MIDAKEELRDLLERSLRAYENLSSMAVEAMSPRDMIRLRHKAEGARLIISYIKDSINLVEGSDV